MSPQNDIAGISKASRLRKGGKHREFLFVR